MGSKEDKSGSMPLVYLDNNATTMVCKEAFELMLPYLSNLYGNPSSLHSFGLVVKEAVSDARKKMASLFGVREGQITFTSGATESINTVLRSMYHFRAPRKKIITSPVEHAAVLDLMKVLAAEEGAELIEVPVDQAGQLDKEFLYKHLDDDVAFVSLMWVNNETGVIFPVEEIAHKLAELKIPFHVDGSQAIGKFKFNLKEIPISAMSFTAHKFHGPKGVGGYYLRRGTRIKKLLVGGGQEWGLRAGTENPAGIIGMGEAARQAELYLESGSNKVLELRNYLESEVFRRVEKVIVNGHGQARVNNTSSISFEGASGEAMLQILDEFGIACSTSSACHSNDQNPSHVLKAMNIPDPYMRGTVRVSLSRFTTKVEVEHFLDSIARVVEISRRTFSAVEQMDDGFNQDLN